MDIILIDEKIKNDLKNTEELLFYIFDTADIIDKYKKILSKPILRSNENKREKSDLIKEYIDIVNHDIENKYFQKKDEIFKEYQEKVKLRQNSLPSPPKVETLEEYEKMIKKLKKAAKTKKPILISYENEDNLFKEYMKVQLNEININKILYYESKSKKICCRRCKNCNGTNITKTDDCEYREYCEDCGLLIERANFIYYYPEKRTSVRKKKKENK